MKRFLLRLAAALVAAYTVLLVGLSFVYTHRLLHPACITSSTPPENYEPISLTTSDDITLSGWWRPPENGAVILLLGGLGASRDTMLPEAALLAGQGYGILTLDTRTCAGETGTLGFREVAELAVMANYAQQQPTVEWIGALGFSVGGTTVLRGAAETPSIQAVVAEGNYANLYQEITYSPAPPLSLQWQVQRLVALFYRLGTGSSPRNVSPIQALPEIAPRPVLLIHGEREIARTQGQAQAAACPSAELWVVPGAGHGEYRQAVPEDYAQRLVNFFGQARAAAFP